MKKYKAYKDTGIQWIGEIPEGWEILKMKNIFSIVAGATPDSNNTAFWDGDIAWVTPADFKSFDHYISSGKRFITREGYDSCSATLVPKGSVVFSKRAPIGSVVIAQNELCTNQGCLSCIQTSKVVTNFYYYALSVFTDALEMYGSGTTFKEISAFDFSNFRVPYPSFSEQQIIADYLDHKVGQIDASISAINAQIDDLKAYRMNVISEAVTKGLNPNVPMKDSGLGWIGAIPEGWKILKMNFILSGLQDGTHGTFDRVDNGYPLLSAKNVFPSGIVFEEKESYISESDFKAIVSNGFPQKGDVALCCVGTVGRCCVYTYDYPMAFQRSVTFLRPNNKVQSYYLWYYLQSNKFQDQLGKYAKTSAQSGVYLGDIAKTIVILPPLSEQQDIATYLDHKTSKIDAAIASLESQRDDLNAFKQSVISEAVTGKIDVRGWKLNNEQ